MKDLPFMPRGPATPSSINSNGHAQDQLIIPRGPPTPSSIHSNGRSASPATTGGGRKSPYRMPPRSATAPLPPRSPSPDIPLPQECAFPVFPTASSRCTTPTTPKKPPTERANTEPVQPQTQIQTHGYARPSESKTGHTKRTAYAALSSMHDVDKGLNAFPEVPRSFSRPASPIRLSIDSQKPRTSDSDSPRRFSFSTTQPDLESLKPPHSALRIPQSQPDVTEKNRHQLPLSLMIGAPSRPSPQHQTADTDSPAPSGPSPKPPAQPHVRKQSVSAAHRPLDEIGNVRTHKHTHSRGRSLVKTDMTINDVPRSLSAGGQRRDVRLESAPPVPEPIEPIRVGWRTSRSAGAGIREGRHFDLPPLPLQAQIIKAESIPSASHAPSDSLSSKASSDSSAETTSSRSSPPVSSLSSSPEKEFATLERTLLSISQTPVEPPPASPLGMEPPRRAPAKSFSRPTYAIVGPTSAPPALPLASIPDEPKPPSQPESPMDPALKGGRLPPLVTDDSHFPPASSRQPQYPQSAVTPNYRGPDSFLDLAPPPLNLQKTPARRATTSHKGKCRGCSEFITGKSVSSADGRLTGRWHKQCFVCKTCKEPFPTMDFYVLGNDPYCGRHYHQLNQTLCSNCDRGIEGQYVETDQQKFHPHCFNCRVSTIDKSRICKSLLTATGVPSHP